MDAKEKLIKIERAWRLFGVLKKGIRKQVDAANELLNMDETQLIANKRQFNFRYLRDTTKVLEDWLVETEE